MDKRRKEEEEKTIGLFLSLGDRDGNFNRGAG